MDPKDVVKAWRKEVRVGFRTLGVVSCLNGLSQNIYLQVSLKAKSQGSKMTDNTTNLW